MQKARIRFIIALGLFAAWIGWLGYLAMGTHDQIVLSRPQFLVSNLHVIAKLTGDADYADGAAVVQEVRSATDPAIKIAKGDRLQVENLDLCRHENGWAGPGDYILALTWKEKQVSLTLVPSSPGFPLTSVNHQGDYLDVLQRKIVLQDKITRALASIDDPKSMATARRTLQRLYPESNKIAEQANALRSLSPEARSDLKKYEELDQDSFGKMLKEAVRVQKLPDGGAFIQSLNSIHIEDDRLRIYPATPQTLDQLRQIETQFME